MSANGTMLVVEVQVSSARDDPPIATAVEVPENNGMPELVTPRNGEVEDGFARTANLKFVGVAGICKTIVLDAFTMQSSPQSVVVPILASPSGN